MTSVYRTTIATSVAVVMLGLLVSGFGMWSKVSKTAHAAPTAHAATRTQLDIQPSGDFVIGPGKTEVSLPPGASTTREISVTNRTDSQKEFHVSIEDFTSASGTDDVVQLLGDQRGPNSLRDFLKPELKQFTLAPGEKITFDVTISIPAGTEPGGRYGAVIIANKPPKPEGTAARVVSRLASLFLVRVEGDMTEEGQLTDFRISGSNSVFWQQSGPQSFEILFENTGNVHLTPYGQITVTNLFGQTVKTIPIDAYFALPDSTRYRLLENPDSGFQIGRYTANLRLNRSYGGNVDTASISYWIIPWKILLIALMIIFFISGIVRWFTSTFELRRKGDTS